MPENKPKNYYTLNLTEGRIFLIFVTIIILLVVIIFGGFLIVANNNKSVEDEMLLNNEETLDDTQDFSMYNELQEDDGIESDSKKEEEIIDAMSTEDTLLTDADQDKSTTIEETGKNEEELVELDDSSKLFSSKFKTNSDLKETTKKTAPVKETKKEVKETVVEKEEPKKQTTTPKVSKKRYIVQVGSYVNKKTAEDISIYYQMQGYPIYIKSKTAEGKTYYRLRVGPFKDESRAQSYLTALKESKYGKGSYISVVYL